MMASDGNFSRSSGGFAAQKPGEKPDPNALQRQASDPVSSVWVGASAGSGKTKVLTDRVLRLLLPRASGRPGTAAYKILCLTFTKAAASEMAMRVSDILGQWAVMDDADLRAKLQDLLGRDVAPEDMAAARRLFADVVDVPGGLKIMTIHSFCQSVLGRFPLEAGLNPQFSVLDESGAQEILLRAQNDVIADGDGEIMAALEHLTLQLNAEQFSHVLAQFVSNRDAFFAVLERHFGVYGLYMELCRAFDIQAGVEADALLAAGCSDDVLRVDDLRRTARLMIENGTKTDVSRGEVLAHWLSLPVEERSAGEAFENYKGFFLTGKGEIRAKLCGKKIGELDPDAPDVLLQEAERILCLQNDVNAAQVSVLTRELCRVSERILKRYETLKARDGSLDFDDLIYRTLLLLNGRSGDKPNSAWVQYKLDQGIDHILVDEAQDTNPEQWKIIEALCEDFFAGLSSDDGAKERTVFVVGDEKQSIYSFQGASREEFSKMRAFFSERVRRSGHEWRPVALDMSFRSTRSVLEAVDSVFSSDDAARGLSDVPVRHYSFRAQQAGRVELWPLFEADEVSEQYSLWDAPVEVQSLRSGGQKLADHIAVQIKGWIDGGEVLPSHDRAVKAGDIMILVRRRGAFVAQLSRALKTIGVAVGGVDRMILGDQLAVQDLMSALRFVLLPDDDLNLACLLKSPLIGLDEEALFSLAYERAGSLWERVRDEGREDVVAYLKRLLQLVDDGGAYDFVSTVLHSPCPADAVSGWRAIETRLGVDAQDAMSEFLNVALDYQITEGRSLQHFVYAQAGGQSDIKREQDEGGDFVRIMTVHGSKGLQAPIVILPDTTATVKNAPSSAGARLLWPRDSGLSVPLWSPHKGLDTPLYAEAKALSGVRSEEEDRRLLYVAMTRAEDRLYVCGHRGKNAPDAMCWYNLVREGLLRHEAVQELDDGVLRLSHAQEDAPDRVRDTATVATDHKALPSWIYEAVAAEDIDLQDIVRPSQMEEVALSPVADEQAAYRFLRGNLTHKLLQVLPDMEVSSRAEAARLYVERFGQDLSACVRAGIVEETLAVLSHPEFSALFSSDSRAEVPISGVIAGKGMVSGQIDRLCVTDDSVLIVDFKTNRPPPLDEKDVPEAYRAQLSAYAAIMRQIYPDHQIKCALLWTDGPRLMPVKINLAS